MTITCTVCGTVNPEGTTYCEGCGVELTAQHHAAAEPEAVTRVEAAARIDGDLPTLPDAQLPTDQVPDSPELAAGVPDMPVTDVPEATAPAPMPVDDAAPVPEAAAESGTAPVAAMPAPTTPTPSDAPAKLGLKKYGAPTGEFIPLHGERLVVGRFDASSGPVDIDLSDMGGQEHISRRHAELYHEGGVWMVRDLGSTNGVYVKKSGESAFSPRLQEPAALHDGDEVAFGNLMLSFHQG